MYPIYCGLRFSINLIVVISISLWIFFGAVLWFFPSTPEGFLRKIWCFCMVVLLWYLLKFSCQIFYTASLYLVKAVCILILVESTSHVLFVESLSRIWSVRSYGVVSIICGVVLLHLKCEKFQSAQNWEAQKYQGGNFRVYLSNPKLKFDMTCINIISRPFDMMFVQFM